jgi:GNAT superfamily N-acetyltransferase
VTRVRVLSGDDWATWRAVRLRSLREDPGAFGSTYARELGFDEAVWRGRLDDPESVSVLAGEDLAPLGIGAGFPDRPGLLHVVAMWVVPEARGNGVAHAVLRVLEEWAAQRGLGLHLDVVRGNAMARRSYERYGFVATGETEQVGAGPDEVHERMLLDRTVSGTP